MTTNDEQVHIKACLEEIEAQLNWGSSARWSNYDFEKLADLIAAKTGVQLSLSTLKRIWGKVSYKNAPSLTTLHTLARFLGYADWRTYQQQFRAPVAAPVEAAGQQVAIAPAPAENVSSAVPVQRPGSKRKRILYILTAALVLLVLIGFMTVRSKVKPAASKFSFSLNKVVSEGVPNTVVFTYDATAAATDSVYIVQTWDIRRKTLVPKNKHEHSAIYYYPGFFRTRLIVDGEVVQRRDLQITSDGWLCLAENNPVPLYFKRTAYIKEDRIEVDTNTLRAYQLSLYPQAPKIRFFNQRDLGSLESDHFTFETKLKNDFSGGSGACQFVEVLIQCKNDIIIIPLAAKPCTGDLVLYACGARAASQDADLSRFGADLSQWTTLRVESRNKQMTFFVNGVQAYSFTIPNESTGIVGLQYRFYGVGAVKDTWFKGVDTVYDFTPNKVNITN
ncbi:hypothetical protein HB364_21335 [Pseudoflavitalea sp. X16]|uniref:hypothetical protein n=1 Tax=Paraflavitalea devenefica TaxID=2716334 RepID=UPI0014231DC0|nr:hypothetical protein [Paraflavitalea devenefica]NII27640.1 hypothetical protein [Paraflavitalea devenefica]